jgi:hypothetical protein
MLKVDAEWIKNAESRYPGITGNIRWFEQQQLPACPHCASTDTADVQCGIIGRTISIGCATTKFKLIPNGPKPGQYFCNACEKFFGKVTAESITDRKKNLDESDLLEMLKKHGGFTVRVEEDEK